MAKVYEGDDNVTMRIIVTQNGQPADISSATDIKMLFDGPGLDTEKTGVFTTDGTDGSIEYVASGNEVLAGNYEYCARLVIAGSARHTEPSTFVIHEPTDPSGD